MTGNEGEKDATKAAAQSQKSTGGRGHNVGIITLNVLQYVH